VSRVLPTAIVFALLAATAAAFVITEGAKLEKSPIAGTRVPYPVFSPSGRGPTSADVEFRLRKAERLEAWIQDSKGRRVRTLQAPRSFPAGANLQLIWDGFTDNGLVEPDGTYTPVVKLLRSHRTVALPNPIKIDTKPPVISVRHPLYPLLSPDGDHRRDSFTIPYRINERAHAILSVRGRQVEYTRSQKPSGELHWNGKLGNPPRPVLPGRYLLTASARDEAGNQSKPFPFAIAQVRYLSLGRDRIVVRPRGKFALRVSTDYPSVAWKLRGRSGVQRTGTLHFRAPKSPGVYRLYIVAGKHSAKCTVVVA
jgi:hypothetical protein